MKQKRKFPTLVIKVVGVVELTSNGLLKEGDKMSSFLL